MVQDHTHGIDVIRNGDPANPGVIVRIKGWHVVLVEHVLDSGGYSIRVWGPMCVETDDPQFTYYTNERIEPA